MAAEVPQQQPEPLGPDADGVNCLAYDEAIMAQQDRIQQEIAVQNPLVSERLELAVLYKEYAQDDHIYQQKIKDLLQKYSYIRKTRPDGNCFYRAFGFAHLEALLEDSQELQRATAASSSSSWRAGAASRSSASRRWSPCARRATTSTSSRWRGRCRCRCWWNTWTGVRAVPPTPTCSPRAHSHASASSTAPATTTSSTSDRAARTASHHSPRGPCGALHEACGAVRGPPWPHEALARVLRGGARPHPALHESPWAVRGSFGPCTRPAGPCVASRGTARSSHESHRPLHGHAWPCTSPAGPRQALHNPPGSSAASRGPCTSPAGPCTSPRAPLHGPRASSPP
uniref:ubiquitinyl hydrolase 1 n=1 Tax=Gallus gallus TaxID=9031 RepID=A0A8V0X0B4_CHICK